MIVGLGVDLTEVDRIEAAIERRGRPFLDRLFTPSEIAYCETHRHRAERFAGRFAAKEAAMKALGTGWARGVRWVDIEVVREPTAWASKTWLSPSPTPGIQLWHWSSLKDSFSEKI
jgi:holo-[acyl-carrier protein] synthase